MVQAVGVQLAGSGMQLAGPANTKFGNWDAEPLGLALAGILGHCIAKAKIGYWMADSHCLAPAGLAGHFRGANSMEMHLAARHVLVHCHVWLVAQGWSYWLLGGACWWTSLECGGP